MIHIVTIYLLF